MTMATLVREDVAFVGRFPDGSGPDHGYDAVVAHSLLNAVSCLRVSIRTLLDDDLDVAADDRATLVDGVTVELDRITEVLRGLVLAR